MARIGVVGQKDKILCFLASGFRVYDAAGADDARGAIERACSEGCEIVFVSPEVEDVMEWADEMYGEAVTPAVILLPVGGSDLPAKRLKSFVERAVGADILSGT